MFLSYTALMCTTLGPHAVMTVQSAAAPAASEQVKRGATSAALSRVSSDASDASDDDRFSRGGFARGDEQLHSLLSAWASEEAEDAAGGGDKSFLSLLVEDDTEVQPDAKRPKRVEDGATDTVYSHPKAAPPPLKALVVVEDDGLDGGLTSIDEFLNELFADDSGSETPHGGDFCGWMNE